MRRKALLEFADRLERSRRPFDMTNGCRCITAYAAAFDDALAAVHPVAYFAKKFDVSHKIACSINSGVGLTWDDVARITRKQAAATLRRLARTGKVKFDQP